MATDPAQTALATMTVDQALRHALVLGLDRLDAQLLALHALGRPAHDRAWLLAHDTDVVPQPALLAFQQAVLRRVADEPLAYITGEKEFFGLTLHVDKRVLVPRPDTETLVEWALELLPPALQAAPLTVVDLGTGSGAIALALKHTRPDLNVVAVDQSADALAMAQTNAQRLQLPLQFVHGSWMDALSGPFHMIVSNPPYIAEADSHLAALRHEPLQALTSGSDGLDDIRTIIRQSRDHLSTDGWLLIEHGHDQAMAVRALLAAAGLQQVLSRRDLAGIERCSGGKCART